MATMKGLSVSKGSDLTDLIGRVRLALKRDDAGAVQAAQFLHLSDDSGEGFYLVMGCEATRGAVNGSTTLALALCAGNGFPPVALLNSREPAPCNVARATDAEVIAAIAVATGGSAVHLNPPAPRPTRAVAREGLRPVEFDCAPVITGRCGTRGQRFEPESLETVSILTPSEGSAEWASAVDAEVLSVVTDEPAATEPVTEVASDEPAPVTDEPATEPAATETPAPRKRSRKG